ncbi:hypothetical protein IQ07DRAFT_593453 [Pyrenochaeta sp. DS3sAY3a]|nr:hypothetical protein IQ07DRAFT_593453 [Pyrenochaeta sp. DS3sAY3a]
MLSSAAQRLFLAQLCVLGVAAHRDWWVAGLPSCWQNCLADTQDGCSSRKCICKTSQSSASFLPDAVSCAVSKCNADDWALELVLGPLQLYCAAIDCAIPEDVVDSAYAAASDTDDEPLQTSVVVSSKTKTKPSNPQTTNTSDDDEDLTSTVRTTMTKTTTDDNGNTLQVIIPIVMGPTGISTGDIITTTLEGKTSSSPLLSRPSPTPGNTSPTLSLPSTSTGPAQATERPYNGNGSPFENMQAGASKWVVSAPILGLGVLAAFCMRF